MFATYIWDIQKNIGVEEKEARNTEEIKKGRKRNRLSHNYFFFLKILHINFIFISLVYS